MGVAVITGGTAGVGRATARRLARAGYSVAVLARGHDGLAATQRELRESGVRALALRVDVSNAAAVRDAAAQIERELGPIEVWVNNAMTTIYGRISDITPEEYRRVTEVTYLGYVWGTQAALSVMTSRNRGTIVQVGSSLAYRGIPLQSAYCGAKHAIRAFTDSLRSELLHDGIDIHLTMVQLPALNTPQFEHCLNKMERQPQPVPPIYQPEVAAEAIYRATRQRRRELYVSPSVAKVVVAQKLVPGLVDRYLARNTWDAQFTPEPATGLERANLFQPLDGDAGAHGRFDQRARPLGAATSLTVWLGAGGLRSLLLVAPLLGAGVLLGRALSARRSRLPPARALPPPAPSLNPPAEPRPRRAFSDEVWA